MNQTESKPSSDKVQYQVPPYLQQFEQDTIDLYELWINIWSKKWWVIVVTGLAALGSVVSTQVLIPVQHKTEALLQAPRTEDIQSLNAYYDDFSEGAPLDYYEKYAVKKMNAADLFVAFKNNLSSQTLQNKFIKEKGMIELLTPQQTPKMTDEDLNKSFTEMIKIEHGEITSVFIEMSDSRNIDKLINSYVDFIDVETVHMVVEEIKNSTQKAKQKELIEIKRNITELRDLFELEKKSHFNKIKKYEEAIQIATRLGIQDRNVEKCSSPNFRNPNYCLGFRTLSIEKEFLEKRKLIDKNISAIPKLEQKIAFLKTQINKDLKKDFHAVSIYKSAHQLKNIYRANRIRIIAIVTVVGLFLGILLVHFVAFFENRKKKQSSKSAALVE